MYQKISMPNLSARKIHFVYIERAILSRKDFSLTINDEAGESEIPISNVVVLLVGNGVTLTDKAMRLVAEMGVTVVWMGDGGVRYYAHGSPISKSSRIAERQALLFSSQSSRKNVARAMYGMRFPDEDVADMTIQQLRGREGTRVKNAYRDAAKIAGIEWNGRIAQISSQEDNDPVNMAITIATSVLYGICHSVIVAIGAIPSLGFVHSGNARSFVFDIADLYKVEIVIPMAFRVSADEDLLPILDRAIRTEMREVIFRQKLIPRIIDDIKSLLNVDSDGGDDTFLWDDKQGDMRGGVDYGDTESHDIAGSEPMWVPDTYESEHREL